MNLLHTLDLHFNLWEGWSNNGSRYSFSFLLPSYLYPGPQLCLWNPWIYPFFTEQVPFLCFLRTLLAAFEWTVTTTPEASLATWNGSHTGQALGTAGGSLGAPSLPPSPAKIHSFFLASSCFPWQLKEEFVSAHKGLTWWFLISNNLLFFF